MHSISYFLPDVNDEFDRRQQDEDTWEYDSSPPAYFAYLTSQGWEPEAAADWVDGFVEADRVTRLGEDGAEAMGLIMELNYGQSIPA